MYAAAYLPPGVVAVNAVVMPANTTRRLRSATDTKARILGAAQKSFSEHAYSHVGVREIAAAAGVNNALIGRYFGSKAELFEAALVATIDFTALSQTDGGSLVGTMLQGVSEQDLQGTAMALRSAGDAEVREVIAKVTNERIIPVMVDVLGPPHAEERALNLLILTCGYLLSTRVLPVGPGDNQFTREWLFQSLQQIIAGSSDKGTVEANSRIAG